MKLLFRSVLLLPLCLMAFLWQSTLSVTSPAFKEGGVIPAKYSCEGLEINPPLRVSGIPSGTRSLAIIVHDPDAPHPGGVYHWVAWNLPTDGYIPENYKGGIQGLNSMKKNGWKGMCPPSGTHHYHFMIFALDRQLQLEAGTDHAGLEKAMQGHILAKAELTGTYHKQK